VRTRWLLVLWLAVGIAVWSGFFDILITRGIKEFFMRDAAFELGRGPAATMPDIMRQTAHDASIIATRWAAFVVLAGWATVWLARRGPRTGT
jgi:hypothetical protein